MRNALVAIVALFAVPSAARAEEQFEHRLATKPLPAGTVKHVGAISPIIYLERCKGGCIIKGGTIVDARTYTSPIPNNVGDHPMGEYQNAAGETGTAADAEWAEVLKCVQEVYSPYNVQVTDVKPTAASYHMNVVAGFGRDIDQPQADGVGNVSCDPINNGISFTFANGVGLSGTARVQRLCYVVAQESGHTFSLDHVYAFGAKSACTDAMTYRADCGGQRFFRNEQGTCGEYTERDCRCGLQQNAHLTLLNIFGPGTPITSAPTVSITSPVNGATIASGAVVASKAFAQRGIKTVELWINGYKWAQADGAAFGQNGQPESGYAIQIPTGVPDGVMDLTIKAKDDIDVTTETTVTVTRGAACATADSCLAGQKCEAGKCFWEPAVGELGDSCAYEQYCVSGLCAGGSDGEKFCTRECVVSSANACGDELKCVASSSGASKGFCVPDSGGGGGCNTGSDDLPYGALMFGLFGVGLVVLRRRR